MDWWVWALIGIPAGWFLWVFIRVQLLNMDPTQRALAELYVLGVNSGWYELPNGGVPENAMRLLRAKGITTVGPFRNRLLHALSLARFQMTPDQYEEAKERVRAMHDAA